MDEQSQSQALNANRMPRLGAQAKRPGHDLVFCCIKKQSGGKMFAYTDVPPRGEKVAVLATSRAKGDPPLAHGHAVTTLP